MLNECQSVGQVAASEKLLTAYGVLSASVARQPDAIAVVSFGRSWTYAELDRDIRAAARVLQDVGLQRGDRLIVQQQNGPQFLIAALAAWSFGASIVPVSPMYRAKEVRQIAVDSEAKAWLMTPKIWDGQGQDTVTGTGIRILLTARTSEFVAGAPARIADAEDGNGPRDAISLAAGIEEQRDKSREDSASPLSPQLSAGDEAVLAYTSGSTGRPRGVVIPHSNLISIGRAYAEASGVDAADEVLLAVAPLVHITGLSLHIGSWLATGCRLVLADRFEPQLFLQTIQDERVTWATGTATAYLAMMKAGAEKFDLSSWRYAGCGGSPIPPQLATEVEASLGVQLGPGYGLTESTAAVTTTRVGEPTRVDRETGIVSVGRPLPGVEIRVVNDSNEALPPGNEGLIQVSGPGRAAGYWRDQEATAAAFLNDGWLQTSDVGFLDNDGWLYIAGRRSQVIIASGYKVWPRQVEDVLYAHPSVREAAVIGVRDEYRGESVKAYVSLKEETSPSELREHCKASLAAYKVPSTVEVLSELPKNPNGKINHLQLKDEANSLAR
ncbi:MAG: class I adenylate-forming enzyme family protein [Gulosibacter sp.]|uniref:class I adenylate-forming enzyme family protein n=1 Tax=Gulosibacter sp. TaxID=2817531 RepID=UPI003F92AA64